MAGMEMEASTAMMAMTTNNSIRVKAAEGRVRMGGILGLS
jgi:hypothetical protein